MAVKFRSSTHFHASWKHHAITNNGSSNKRINTASLPAQELRNASLLTNGRVELTSFSIKPMLLWCQHKNYANAALQVSTLLLPALACQPSMVHKKTTNRRMRRWRLRNAQRTKKSKHTNQGSRVSGVNSGCQRVETAPTKTLVVPFWCALS